MVCQFELYFFFVAGDNGFYVTHAAIAHFDCLAD